MNHRRENLHAGRSGLREAFRLGVLVSHPVQYLSPWFRHLATRVELEVHYAHRQDAEGQAAAGFGVPFQWDVPLLEGYRYHWLQNRSARPGLHSFGGCDTPEIYTIVKERRYQAFLVFGWNRKCYLQAILACRYHRVPVFMRGDSQLDTSRSPLKAAAKYLPYRWFLPRLQGHLFVGKRNKTYLQHYGVPDEKLFFVPHCVDNGFFSRRAESARQSGEGAAFRRRLGIPPNAFVFLYAGKFLPGKRPGDFLQAFRRVQSTHPGTQAHALLAGEGLLKSELEKLAADCDGRVHFAGFCNQSQMPVVYSAADVLVLPGEETWGLVANEALACGLPVIAADAAGCSTDLVEEGITGFTFPLGDVAGLAVRLQQALQHFSPLPQAVSRAVAEKARVYSIEAATGGLLAALDTLGMGRVPGTRWSLPGSRWGLAGR